MKKILLVDDDALVRMTLGEFLTLLGLDVVEAKNGTEGIEMARQYDFKILITDFKMPDMNGIEMLRRIREFKRDFKTILLTGFVREISDSDIAELEIYTVLEKPVNLAELEHIITLLLVNDKNKN